jgi:hypothetical protein
MTSSASAVDHAANINVRRCARIPGLRALAWSGDILYTSRGYDLLRARIEDPGRTLDWELVGTCRPSWKRMLSVKNRLTARLFRDGFHALAVLPSSDLVAAVPGAIVTKRANDFQFRATHTITRGTRPLHITAAPNGIVYWGEYFDNAVRDEVHIYASRDSASSWSVAYTFPKGAIRHVHNVVHDPWGNCLWILTGDYGNECRILRATCDLSSVEVVLQGNQQARAVAAIAAEDGLYFSSDTPLEGNHIYRLDPQGVLTELAAINNSSIYGCRVKDKMFFSTMVEPSEVNRDRTVKVYSAEIKSPQSWDSVLHWKKDLWPMGLFQYGNAFLPDGNNETPYLAVTTIAVDSDDMATSIYSL